MKNKKKLSEMENLPEKKNLSKKKKLSEREEMLMELLWESRKPLTSVELLRLPEMEEWNEAYMYRALKSLLDKQLIRVCGVEQCRTQYARQFEPALTKEEYAVKLLTDRGMKKSSIAKIAMALVEDAGGDEEGETDELIGELELIIEKLRKDKGK